MSQPNNPLHGVKLQQVVETLVRTLGWRRLGELVDVRSFNVDPSVKSSLRFLRRTPWARAKVEALWLEVDAHQRGQRERYDTWLASVPTLTSVIDVGARAAGALDFGQASPWWESPAHYTDLDAFGRRVGEALAAQDVDVGYGGYLEDRPFYTTTLFAPGGKAAPRTLHLGLDIWSPAGEAVYAPLPGRIHGFRQNDGPRDYGATIVLEHEVSAGTTGAAFAKTRLRFHTLYGHLSAASLEGRRLGQRVEAGAVLATTGKPHENGGWPPHLHFQVILDTLGHEGDFPGVVASDEGAWWARICPNPAAFFSVG